MEKWLEFKTIKEQQYILHRYSDKGVKGTVENRTNNSSNERSFKVNRPLNMNH